jgi:hypothetical protein
MEDTATVSEAECLLPVVALATIVCAMTSKSRGSVYLCEFSDIASRRDIQP